MFEFTVVVIVVVIIVFIIFCIVVSKNVKSSIKSITLVHNKCTLEKRQCKKCGKIENIMFLPDKSPLRYECTTCLIDIDRWVISDALWDYYDKEWYDSRYEYEMINLKERMKNEWKRLLRLDIPELFLNESSYQYESPPIDKGDIMVMSCMITDLIKSKTGNTSAESLGDAIKLIKDKIPESIYKKLSFLNYHRNRFAHDSSYNAIPILDDFVRTANEVISYLYEEL